MAHKSYKLVHKIGANEQQTTDGQTDNAEPMDRQTAERHI